MRPMCSFVFAGLAGLALVVSGCSSSAGEVTAPRNTAGTAAAPAATVTEGSGSATNDQLASRLCTALSKVTATAEMDVASAAAAQAQIAIALANVYGDDVDQMDGADIEAMTAKTCPEVHDSALKLMKVRSFDEL